MPKFRLATLLKLRLDERDRCRLALAQAQEAERLLAEQRGGIERELQAHRTNLGKLTQRGSANVDAVLQANRYEMVLRGQLREIAAQFAQVTEEVERRRLVLVEADRQVRVLEKLRENQAAEAVTAELAAEAKELDESALIGFRRKAEANA